MSRTLRKSDLASRVATRMGGARAAGETAVNAVVSAIQDALVTGDRVVITGFGSFEVRQIKERKVRPIRGARAGQPMTVPAHRRVSFSPGMQLERRVTPSETDPFLRARALRQRIYARGGNIDIIELLDSVRGPWD